MALSELTSNLSWYGTNAGFRAAQSVEQTRFTLDTGDLTVSSAPRGFDNAGNQSNAFIPKISGNSFNVFEYGSASRRSQLGSGTKFPIGPKGEIHEFDVKRTGFHDGNRYETLFNSKSTKGLGDTYTVASPIDDMYNKFKVRDEAHDPFGYAKPPFILRGIQRDDSSKPQRWGFGDTAAGVISSLLDIPRGGPLTSADRILNDALRLGKMLIRPQGIAFVAKQQLLGLMQPNTEGVTGYPNLNVLTNQKLSNPLNTLASALGSPLGLRFKKYGLLPIDDEISKYGDIHRLRNLASVGIPVNVKQNRLVLLNGDRKNTLLPTWITLDSVSGPNSIGGLGDTTFRKRIDYDTYKIGTTAQRLLDQDRGRTFLTQYGYIDPYTDGTESQTDPTPVDVRKASIIPNFTSPYAKDSLQTRVNDRNFTAIPQKNEPKQAASNVTRENGDIIDYAKYKTLAYGTIKKLAKDRTHNSSDILDYTNDTTDKKWDPTKSKIALELLKYKDSKISGQKDTTRVDEKNKNYINFTIGDVSLYAYLTGLSFSNQMTVDEKRGAMEAYGQYVYGGHSRNISLSFFMAAKSPTELERNWKKIKRLQSLSGANYTSGVVFPKSTTLTVGSIVRGIGVIMESVSMDIDQESPWELTDGYQYPYYITVDAEFTILPTSSTSLPRIG